MSNYLKASVKNVRNINSFNIDMSFERGLYAVVGRNGCGKSTIMLILSQLVRKSSLRQLTITDISPGSEVIFEYGDKKDNYAFDKKRSQLFSDKSPNIHLEGFYEGSIFYGTRFVDSIIAEDKLTELVEKDALVESSDFVKEKLGLILKDDKNYYKGLMRIRNRHLAQSYGFKGMPYFLKTDRGYISQLAMSSGECMLISLLHFLDGILFRVKNKNQSGLILIDEVELALHPVAIHRMVELISDIISEYNLICIFSSHSAELIRMIEARNIYLLENENGVISVSNPCYPCYAIRDLYIPDGYDYLILTEDILAKKIVDDILDEDELFKSKLIQVLPAGNWFHNLRLNLDLNQTNVLGFGKEVISIIDGDVIKLVNDKKEFSNLKKLFLPIPSVEKYLYMNLVCCPNVEFMKFFGDKYFRVRSLKDILFDYRNNYTNDNNGKKLYDMLLSNMQKNGLSSDEFINKFSKDILKFVDVSKFKGSISKLLK